MLTVSSGITAKYFQTKTYNQNRPSFGHRLPNKVFTNIYDIPNLTCGCCKNVMPTKEEISLFLSTLVPKAGKTLKSKSLEPYKETEAYAILCELAKNNPKKSVRQIITTDEAVSALKQTKVRTQLIINEIADLTDTMTGPSAVVIKKLDKYRHLFKGDFKEIANIMEIYSHKYPAKTFSQIFKNPEVKNYHKRILELHKEKMSLQKTNVLKKISKLSEKLQGEDLKLLRETNSQANVIINNEYYKNNIREALINDLYADFVQKCSNKKAAAEIAETAKDFPFVKDLPDSFFVNTAEQNFDDISIIRSIIEETQATFEHIKAKSKDGKNVWSNGILLCKHCNNERDNLPYPFFLKIHPEMIKNVQIQMNRIISFINGKKLIECDSYPREVKETLLRETNNIIQINISKYFKHKELLAKADLERAKLLSKEAEENYQTAHKNFMETQKKLKEAMDAVNKIKRESSQYQTEASSLHSKKMDYEKVVTTAQHDLNKIQQLKEEDNKLNQSIKNKK